MMHHAAFFRHFPVYAAILIAVTSGAPCVEGAQQESEQPSLRQVHQRVSKGAIVQVLDRAGGTFKGRLVAAAADSLELEARAGTRRFAVEEIERVRWQRSDSLLNGFLIGAAVGSVHGIYWLISDPNECTGLCAEDYILIAAGAALGGFIDHRIKELVTVYSAPARKNGPSFGLRPWVNRERHGLQFILRF